MEKVNLKLLPIKAHYFFFMAAMGPILPQLSVFGREMGISPVIMGSVTGILPLAFLVAKPLFGLLVDIYRTYRKSIFVGLIVVMSLSYSSFYFIPPRTLDDHQVQHNCTQLDTCNVTMFDEKSCAISKAITCTCPNSKETKINGLAIAGENGTFEYSLCTERYPLFCNTTCDLRCTEDIEIPSTCIYSSSNFWFFIVFMAVGTVAFNVANSLSDAICFDVIGEEHDYGKQRMWGTIGFGVTALVSGYVVDIWSDKAISYRPAIICMLIFTVFDLAACAKLKLPIIESPANIFKDLKNLLSTKHTAIFIAFSVCAGVVDGFIVYFLFWYLEDLAAATGTENVKLLEGMVVAAETLVGEVIFFYISGKILERFGHAHAFSMCFVFYALRLGLISIVPSPWWILPIEFIMQGPTYALTYTTIVAYANAIAPTGMSATMQGLAAGMDDGFGYALGSFLGGLMYKYIGGRGTFQVVCAFALVCSIVHSLLHRTLLQEDDDFIDRKDIEYHVPGETDLEQPDEAKC